MPQAHAVLLWKTGGRKFQCLDCDGNDPLRSPEVANLLAGELRPFGVKTRIAEYRAYTVGVDGHFIRFEPLVCRDDGEALAKSRCLIDGDAVEVWSGDRLVIRLEHNQNNSVWNRT
jgi:hypothetical protein